jgi:hypothetical protein
LGKHPSVAGVLAPDGLNQWRVFFQRTQNTLFHFHGSRSGKRDSQYFFWPPYCRQQVQVTFHKE